VPGDAARAADSARVPAQYGHFPLPIPHGGRPPRHNRRRKVRYAGAGLRRDPLPHLRRPRPPRPRRDQTRRRFQRRFQP